MCLALVYDLRIMPAIKMTHTTLNYNALNSDRA